MRVTYLFHSGFTVQAGDELLVFDYWAPRGPLLTAADLAGFRQVSVFVSHGHHDHFDPAIYGWRAENVRYVLSGDIPPHHEGSRIAPGQTLSLPGMSVTALPSTDQGVAFLVESGGRTVFHAGDLNLWHWPQESTAGEVRAARDAFLSAVAPLAGRQIDLCMFPVDPRQGDGFDEGALWVLEHIRPRVFLPMHFASDPAALQGFAARARGGDVRLLTREGESIDC